MGAYGDGIDFFALKGSIEALLRELRVENISFQAVTDAPSYHPGRCAQVYAGDQGLARGVGRTKKEAESQAAKTTLARLSEFFGLGGGEEIDSTLALPEPEMDDGLFVAWRTEYSPALDEDGLPVAGEVGSYGGDAKGQIGRFDIGGATANAEDGEHAHELWAEWDFVETHTVAFESNGGSAVASQKVRDGDYARAPADPVREGWVFAGWYEDEALTRAFGFATTRVVRDMTLYAKWVPGEVPPGQHAVTFDAAGGAWGDGSATRTVAVADGDLAEEPEAPKRAGWQHAGWARADGSAWDFGTDVVTDDVTLFASWTLRLDVTVPVSVAFAVSAETGDVTAPEMGAYALKSRTVAPVEVEAVSLESRQAELEAFFELAEGAGWQDALGETELTLLADAPGAPRLALALAGDAGGAAWRSAYALTSAERALYRMDAFDYAGTALDEPWQGGDPSERLPLELGMTVSDKLKPRADLDGLRPITRLQLTVAARG